MHLRWQFSILNLCSFVCKSVGCSNLGQVRLEGHQMESVSDELHSCLTEISSLLNNPYSLCLCFPHWWTYFHVHAGQADLITVEPIYKPSPQTWNDQSRNSRPGLLVGSESCLLLGKTDLTNMMTTIV